MPKSALQNLQTAQAVIRRTLSRVSELQALGDSDDLANERENLKRAQEVRAISALQILGEDVDEHARELVTLNGRRNELAEKIQGFLKMEFTIDGDVRTPIASRIVSAALLDQVGDMVTSSEAISLQAEAWKSQLNALLGDPDATVTLE